jgi:hypothetical protein
MVYQSFYTFPAFHTPRDITPILLGQYDITLFPEILHMFDVLDGSLHVSQHHPGYVVFFWRIVPRFVFPHPVEHLIASLTDNVTTVVTTTPGITPIFRIPASRADKQ